MMSKLTMETKIITVDYARKKLGKRAKKMTDREIDAALTIRETRKSTEAVGWAQPTE